MQQILAIIRPTALERVLEQLRFAPLEALEIREVKGFGRQKSYLDQYSESEYSAAFLPKIELSLWVDPLRCEEVVQLLVGSARFGRMGDGKLFVLPCHAFYDIATSTHVDSES